MDILESINALMWLGWSIFTFWTFIQIIKSVWPILKEDWFWFAWKSWYYGGAILGLIWFIVFKIQALFIGTMGDLLMVLIQVCIVYAILHKRQRQKLEWAAWLSIPFFIYPFWLAYKQGLRNGELPNA